MRRSVGFIVFPIVFAASGEFADGGSAVADSTIVSCRCAENSLHCADLDRFVRKQPGRGAPLFARNFLDSLGFFHAHWDTVAIGRYRVTPGGRSVIVSETVEGGTVSLDSFSRRGPPRPYDAGEINDRGTAIGRFLAERGYPFAAISVSIRPSRNSPSFAHTVSSVDSLAVVYSVATDRKCLFAVPQLRGATVTRPKLLYRDVPIERGELFDVRKIERTRLQLSRRPYIAAVSIGKFAVEPDALREGNEPRDVDYVAVPVMVYDRSGFGMEGAFGLNSSDGEGPFFQGDVTLSLLNLFHSGESAYLSYAGDRTYQKVETEVSKPWLFGAPLTGSASSSLEIHEKRYGYLAGEAGATVELENDWHIGVRLKASEAIADSAGTDPSGKTWRYTGADLLLSRFHERPAATVFSHAFLFATGGGIAQRGKKNYGRSHVDFSVEVHVPLLRRHAVRGRFVSKHLITEEDLLVDAEKYRVGGARSVRGYSENEFAFRTVVYNQLEYVLYFNPTGSAYIFMDGGCGFTYSPSLSRWNERRDFLGYGLGIRIPARLGMVSFEWARSYEDTRSWGRVHVMVRNPLYNDME